MTSLLRARFTVMLAAAITVPVLVSCSTVPATTSLAATPAAPGAVATGLSMPGMLASQSCGTALVSGPGAAAHPIRQLFANTIAVVVQGVTTGLAGGVVQGITGSITNWFDRKQGIQNQAALGAAAYPPAAGAYGQPAAAYPQPVTGYPQAPGAFPAPTVAYPSPAAGCPQFAGAYPQAAAAFPPVGAAAYPTYPQAAAAYPGSPVTYPAVPAYPPAATAFPPSPTTYPAANPMYPAAATAYPQTAQSYGQPPMGVSPGFPTAAVPATGAQYPPVFPPAAPVPAAAMPASYFAAPIQVFDTKTGQASTAVVSAPVSATIAAAGVEPVLYAGLAYEVHLLGAGGATTAVNAATYEFHSGDRFVVHFRPTLPGHLQVSNINPLGVKTRIDSTDLAAGVMKTLGPYEFTAATGDESLQLTLTPCQSPQLLASTRDIIKVSSMDGGTSGSALSSCSMTTRDIPEAQTRDIVKVALDDSTSYALDPVSAAELSSGHLATREITIVFHHR